MDFWLNLGAFLISAAALAIVLIHVLGPGGDKPHDGDFGGWL
jgi:hypothetical protein